MKKRCLECNKVFKPVRSSAIFCRDTCRINHCQKKKRKERKRITLQQKIHQHEVELENSKLNKLALDAQAHRLQQDITQAQQVIDDCEQQLSLNSQAFFQQHLQPKLTASKHEWVNTVQLGIVAASVLTSNLREQQMRKDFINKKFFAQWQVRQLQAELEQVREEKQKLLATTQQLMIEKERLKQKLTSLLPQAEIKLPAKAEPAAKAPQIIGIGAADLLKSSFDTFTLPGELGRFFGKLERQMLAIGLVGDPGAGKSTFSFAIAQLLDQAGFSVIYFSLELGVSEVLRDMLARHPVSNRMRIVDKGTLEQVRQSAQQFDCVIIDSFGKLNCRAEELDRLRNDFPSTVFLFILQKTTQGSSRGGAAINYDCSMVIDVIKRDGKRIAMMKKSRYGTIGWEYDLDAEEIVQS